MRALLLALLVCGLTPAVPAQDLKGFLQALRSDKGLSAPEWDPDLAASCEGRAAELAAGGQLSHTDAQGRGPGLQAMALGLPPGDYGEVLGSGLSAAAVWAAWLASPPHRAVLLEPGWTKWGVGTAVYGDVTVFVLRLWRP